MRVRAFLALVLLFTVVPPCPAGDAPSLEDAGRLENSGDAAAAVKAYRAWLQGNPGSVQADSVFAALFRLLTNLPDLFELSSLPGLGPQSLLSLAKLAEISGRAEEARVLYERSWKAGAGLEALVPLLLLSLDMNDTESIGDLLDTLRQGDGGWAEAIGAYADLAAGRLEAARDKFFAAAGTTEASRVALLSLWGLTECAKRAGDAVAAAAAEAEIGRRFPGSPEQALAAGRIGRPTGPSQFAGIGQAIAPDAPRADTPLYSVQAGSFQVKENADELAADLSKKGFAPVVRGEAREGKTLFKVMAGAGMERSAAQLIVGRLSRAGYAGFIVSEAR